MNIREHLKGKLIVLNSKPFILIFQITFITFLISIAFSTLHAQIYIKNSGIIAAKIQKSDLYLSEYREMAFSRESLGGCDWDTIADTVASYNFTGLEIPALFNYLAYYPSDYVPQASPRDELNLSIGAAHARNLSVAVEFAVLYKSPKDEWKIIKADGSLVNWLDPTNLEARTHVLNLVNEVVSKYDFETLVLDYIRYDDIDLPYTESARQQFSQYLGENITEWPGPFAPNGTRWSEFVNWRRIPIDTLVKEIRDTVKSIKPDMELAAATLFWPGSPKWAVGVAGQDPIEWIRQGYLDRVKPMTYRIEFTNIKMSINAYMDYAIAGPEGKVPITPYLSPTIGGFLNETEFKERIDFVRELGVDGFTICSYGGPGDKPNNTDPRPDIRPYLDILELPKPYALSNIAIWYINETSVKITWETSQPATSKIEYNAIKIFDVTSVTDIPYPYNVNVTFGNMTYVPGVSIINTTLKKEHEFILTGLQKDLPYYFRVQSESFLGIISSTVYEFKI